VKTPSTRTFQRPSSATLAPLRGRPIAIRWLGAPDEDLLKVPSEVELATSYNGVVLDDGRIVLTPTGAPLERAGDQDDPAATKPRDGARKRPAAPTKKTTRPAPAKAQGRDTSPRRGDEPSAPSKRASRARRRPPARG
jgi:hypothetical protein